MPVANDRTNRLFECANDMEGSFMDGPFGDLDGPDAEEEGAGREVKDGAE